MTCIVSQAVPPPLPSSSQHLLTGASPSSRPDPINTRAAPTLPEFAFPNEHLDDVLGMIPVQSVHLHPSQRLLQLSPSSCPLPAVERDSNMLAQVRQPGSQLSRFHSCIPQPPATLRSASSPNVLRRAVRPKSIAVAFTVGSLNDSDSDNSPTENMSTALLQRRLSFNGHQDDHLAALQTLVRSTSTPVDLSEALSPTLPNSASLIASESLSPPSVDASVAQPSKLSNQLDEIPKVRPMTKQDAIIYELWDTERDYVGDLKILMASFFDRLGAVSWLPAEKKFFLLRNAGELYKFNLSFYTMLSAEVGLEPVPAIADPEERRRSLDRINDQRPSLGVPENNLIEKVGNLFLRMESEFRVYAEFCTHHDAALTILKEYERTPEMETFLNDWRASSNTRRLDVRAYLIKPVQRLCRYPLLLSELINATPADDPKRSMLEAAHAIMQNLALEIDSAKWRIQNTHRTDRLFARLEPGLFDIPSRLTLNDFLLGSALFVTNHDTDPTRERYRGVFLFPSCVIIIKPRRANSYAVKSFLSLSTCELVLPTHTHSKNSVPQAWRLKVRDTTDYYDFYTKSARVRSIWIDTLNTMILAQRTHSIPVALNETPITDLKDNGPMELQRHLSGSSVTLQAGSKEEVPFTNHRAATFHGSRRRERSSFWRQSSALDLRADFESPVVSQGGLGRRASLDIENKLIDVLTPISDTNSGSKIPMVKSLPDITQMRPMSIGIDMIKYEYKFPLPDTTSPTRVDTITTVSPSESPNSAKSPSPILHEAAAAASALSLSTCSTTTRVTEMQDSCSDINAIYPRSSAGGDRTSVATDKTSANIHIQAPTSVTFASLPPRPTNSHPPCRFPSERTRPQAPPRVSSLSTCASLIPDPSTRTSTSSHQSDSTIHNPTDTPFSPTSASSPVRTSCSSLPQPDIKRKRSNVLHRAFSQIFRGGMKSAFTRHRPTKT
ncbi:hypothetical protein DFS34DRAFT_399432 [Phlyctochytrium arcticum]|nr:hypothetical protein DFS34DRAFT_399432 [Phlyctochytrium arcticum]